MSYQEHLNYLFLERSVIIRCLVILRTLDCVILYFSIQTHGHKLMFLKFLFKEKKIISYLCSYSIIKANSECLNAYKLALG